MQQPPNQWGQQGPPQGYQQPPQYPQQGYQGPPPMQQPPPKKKPNIGCLVAIAVVLVIIVVAVSNKGDNTTTTAQSTPTAQSTTAPTPASDTLPVTNGKPAYNGPLSDFVGTYGKPDYVKATGPYNFYAVADKNTVISVETTSDKIVNRLTVTTLNKWTLSETKTYCEKFLPSGAAQYLKIEQATNALYNYHSAVGDIVLMIPDASSCLMYPK